VVKGRVKKGNRLAESSSNCPTASVSPFRLIERHLVFCPSSLCSPQVAVNQADIFSLHIVPAPFSVGNWNTEPHRAANDLELPLSPTVLAIKYSWITRVTRRRFHSNYFSVSCRRSALLFIDGVKSQNRSARIQPTPRPTWSRLRAWCSC
jgi:hypothetical protein